MPAADAQNGFSGVSKGLSQNQLSLISGGIDALRAQVRLAKEGGVQIVTASEQEPVTREIGRRAVAANGEAPSAQYGLFIIDPPSEVETRMRGVSISKPRFQTYSAAVGAESSGG